MRKIVSRRGLKRKQSVLEKNHPQETIKLIFVYMNVKSSSKIWLSNSINIGTMLYNNNAIINSAYTLCVSLMRCVSYGYLLFDEENDKDKV